jgi:2-polyprenyl-6-methoxyphenol hydroxylase-like FAD-dependent oxidoreductase
MGLEDRVHFGKTATGFAQEADGAVLRLSDGSEITALVVVGADGVGSQIAAQLLPGLAPQPLPVMALWGATPAVVSGRSLLPQSLARSGVTALGDSRSLAVFFTSMRFPERPSEVFARLAPGWSAPVDEDYLMWGIVFGPDRSPAAATANAPAQLLDAAQELTCEFHPIIRDMIAASDQDTIMRTVLRASLRPNSWPTGNVALLGDAAHTMPPFGAHGGNTALRDAAMLSRKLQPALRGEVAVAEAVTKYHSEMSAYAFDLVASAVKGMKRLTDSNGIQRLIMTRLLPAFHRTTDLAS